MAFLAAVPVWFQVASTAISVISTLSNANKQAQAYEAQAQAHENNARAAVDQAAADEATHRNRIMRLSGQQRTAVAKAGVTNSGSALDVAEDTAMESELDALNIRYGGLIRSNNSKYEAAVSRWQGDQVKSQARLSAFGTILGAAGSIYGSMNSTGSASGAAGGSGLRVGMGPGLRPPANFGSTYKW